MVEVFIKSFFMFIFATWVCSVFTLQILIMMIGVEKLKYKDAPSLFKLGELRIFSQNNNLLKLEKLTTLYLNIMSLLFKTFFGLLILIIIAAIAIILNKGS